MINEKNIRFIFFISGLSIGVLGAAIFVKNKPQKKQTKLSVSDVQIISERVFTMLAKQELNNDSKGSSENTKNSQIKKLDQIDKSLEKIINENADTKLESSSENNSDYVESSKFSSSDFDKIEVRKDELLSYNNTYIYNLDFDPNKSDNESDSLLSLVSGVETENFNQTKFPIILEYWQSPVHFKGYKFAKNKIAVYGLEDTKPAKLFKLADKYYLRYDKVYYKVGYTFEHKAFDRVNDPFLLGKLNAMK